MVSRINQTLSAQLDLGDSGWLKPTGALTVAGWFQRLLDNRGTLWCNYWTDGPTYKGSILDILDDDTLYFWLGIGTDFNSGHIRMSTSTVSVGGWHHIAVTWQAMAQAKLYIDATEVTYNGTGNLTSVGYDLTNITRVGSLQVGGTTYYRGNLLVADLRVHDIALSQAHIQAIYAGRGSDTIRFGQRARWPLLGDYTNIGPLTGPASGTNTTFEPGPFKRLRG